MARVTDPEATGEDVGTRAFLEHAGEDGQTIRVLLERLPFRLDPEHMLLVAAGPIEGK